MEKIRTGEIERRVLGVDTPIEVRADGDKRGIAGLAIPVGAKTDIGPFTEEIARSAVTDAIEQGWDVRGLYNHDPNYVLGRTGSKTMSISQKRAGMAYDIPELPASRADVLEAIMRGDVSGNSFSFTVAEEAWDHSEELPKPHRTIKRFGQLFDVGPVTFPAYEADTVVSARSLELATENTEPPAATEHDEVVEEQPVDNMADRRRKMALVDFDLEQSTE